VHDLRQLFVDQHRSLFRYLVRLCGDADLAEDGAQEAFVRLFERPPARDVERAWLFKVATNVVLEQLRTQARRKRLATGAASRLPIGDPSPDPHERIESMERHDSVSEALAVLSSKERAAVLMREEGFSHREIAVAIGTTTGAIGTLIARSLIKVADALPAERDLHEDRRTVI
jgi:RNA polymerase sigma factor (sigma-70 family)